MHRMQLVREFKSPVWICRRSAAVSSLAGLFLFISRARCWFNSTGGDKIQDRLQCKQTNKLACLHKLKAVA